MGGEAEPEVEREMSLWSYDFDRDWTVHDCEDFGEMLRRLGVEEEVLFRLNPSRYVPLIYRAGDDRIFGIAARIESGYGQGAPDCAMVLILGRVHGSPVRVRLNQGAGISRVATWRDHPNGAPLPWWLPYELNRVPFPHDMLRLEMESETSLDHPRPQFKRVATVFATLRDEPPYRTGSG